MTGKVAIIGAGLIGRAWSIVFARAGHTVCLYDSERGAVADALESIERTLPDLEQSNLLRGHTGAEVRTRMLSADNLDEAVTDVVHVQENVSERVEIKRALFAELDRLAPLEAVLASSTSAIPASEFTKTLAGRERCVVAHPVNPPHLVPLVELVPAPWTSERTIARSRKLMAAVGQSPITLKREVPGFVLNRLQGALLSEAFRLVEDEICDTADVDAAVAQGLGLRWSFMGPFETIDLNAPAGLADYCERFGPMYYEMAKSRAAPRPWSPDLVRRIESQRRERLTAEALPDRQEWRDRRLAATVAAKRRADYEIGP